MKTEDWLNSELNQFVKKVEGRDGYRRPCAFGVGVWENDTMNSQNILFCPVININSNFTTAAILADSVGHLNGTKSYKLGPEQFEIISKRFKYFEDTEECLKVPNYDRDICQNIDAIMMISNSCFWGQTVKSPWLCFIDQRDFDSGPETLIDGHFRVQVYLKAYQELMTEVKCKSVQ